MTVTLAGPRLTARIKPRGAELSSLRDGQGREFLWQAGPEWPRHAPMLFPIVGRLAGDRLLAGGEAWPMRQHGFARDLDFTPAEQSSAHCRFVLEDGEATWGAYPFRFRLEADFALRDATLSIAWTVTNTGEGLLPYSIGAHPAFAWPLPANGAGAAPKAAHRIEFEQEEAPQCHRLAEGLLDPTPRDWPINGRLLALREELFREDAVILLATASRRLRYAAPDGPWVELAWQGFPQLGLWSRPGAGFLCLEPWAGHADPSWFTGDIFQKPGIGILAPGERRQHCHRITVGAAPPR